MKVVIAHKYFYPRDGVTTHVFDLIDLLESHGHTVIPFAMKHPDANFQFPISNVKSCMKNISNFLYRTSILIICKVLGKK